METIIWIFIALFILGESISKSNNEALQLSFVIFASSLLASVLTTVNDMTVIKCALAAAKAAPGICKAWKGFAEALSDLVFYYKMEKKAQA